MRSYPGVKTGGAFRCKPVETFTKQLEKCTGGEYLIYRLICIHNSVNTYEPID